MFLVERRIINLVFYWGGYKLRDCFGSLGDYLLRGFGNLGWFICVKLILNEVEFKDYWERIKVKWLWWIILK